MPAPEVELVPINKEASSCTEFIRKRSYSSASEELHERVQGRSTRNFPLPRRESMIEPYQMQYADEQIKEYTVNNNGLLLQNSKRSSQYQSLLTNASSGYCSNETLDQHAKRLSYFSTCDDKFSEDITEKDLEHSCYTEQFGMHGGRNNEQ